MITELLDVNGEKKKRKKTKRKEKNETEKENENENIQEMINEEKPITSSIYLNEKLNELQINESLKKGINLGIAKSNKELKEDIKNDKLSINKNVLSNSELLSLNKSLENSLMGNNRVFLTGINKFNEKEKMKNFKFLKTEEEILRKNIEKLNQNQKLIENSMPLKTNVVERRGLIKKMKMK